MSMEDILKVLVNSRQQGNSPQNADPMANLIGGLLGGGKSQGGVNLSDGVDAGDVMGLVGGLMGAAQQQPQQSQNTDPMTGLLGSLLGGGQAQQPQAQNNSQQAGGLGSMMGLLETVMGGGQSGSQSTANDPMMGLLKPFVGPLAKKANIPPEIAMIVVSFVAHKLLAHHPTSGRDSNSFNLDDMIQQMSSGKIDSNLLHNSGMVKELSMKTGLDEATAARSLEMGFSMVGKGAASLIQKNQKKPTAKPSAAGAVKSTGTKGNAGEKK